MLKSKILFILHIPPPVHGSSMVGQYIKESKIIQEEFDCRYVNLSTSISMEEMGKNLAGKFLRFLSIFLNVFTNLIFHHPKLCYFAITVKGPAFYKDALIVLLLKLFRINIVFHLHNKGLSSRQEKFFDNLLYQKIFKNKEVILLSRYLYSDIQKYVPENKVHYCPNGIPNVVINEQLIIKREKNEITNILFLSNLIESKGVFVLLEACHILKEKQLHFKCTFVGGKGDVTLKQFIQKVNDLGIIDIVHFAGLKYGDDKYDEFSRANIFAFPTYYHNETFGLVNLEAMQFSLPIVSTYEGGIPDVIEEGKTGFLVSIKNAKELADRLEILINNPKLRKQMGEAGREKYEREFTLNVFEVRLTKILNAILLK